MTGILRRCCVLILLMAALPAGADASPTADRSLEALLAADRPGRLFQAMPGQGAGDVIAAAAALERWPTTCATPFVLALDQRADVLPAELKAVRQRLGSPPALFSERALTTRDGAFSIRYGGLPPGAGLPAVDSDGNGHVDLVDHVAEALVVARSYLIDRLGYPDPAGAGGPVPIYVTEPGGGVEALAVWREALGEMPGSVQIDSRIAADRIMSTVIHQVAHLSLAMIDRRASPWWSEATAAWLTVAATGDLSGFAPSLRDRQQASGKGLATDDLVAMEGALIWPMFLAEMTGDPSLVRQIWTEEAASGLDPLAAADVVLRRATGLPLSAALREFAAWNLFTGSRDDGAHYAAGRVIPETTLVALGAGLPFTLGPLDPLGPGGSLAFRVTGDGRRGSLDFEVRAEGGLPGADLLVWLRGEGAPTLIPAQVSAQGPGRVAIPWSDVSEAWIVLRNDATGEAAPARFEARGALDPFSPFDLASFAARTIGRTVQLEWTTAAEKGLVGWNVYRSDAPTGRFARLNDVLIPAFGDSNDEIGYLFVDEPAPPGRRFYYQIEGMTSLGLPERSFLVSVRTGVAR